MNIKRNKGSIFGISTGENPRVDTTVGQKFLPPAKNSSSREEKNNRNKTKNTTKSIFFQS